MLHGVRAAEPLGMQGTGVAVVHRLQAAAVHSARRPARRRDELDTLHGPHKIGENLLALLTLRLLRLLRPLLALAFLTLLCLPRPLLAFLTLLCLPRTLHTLTILDIEQEGGGVFHVALGVVERDEALALVETQRHERRQVFVRDLRAGVARAGVNIGVNQPRPRPRPWIRASGGDLADRAFLQARPEHLANAFDLVPSPWMLDHGPQRVAYQLVLELLDERIRLLPILLPHDRGLLHWETVGDADFHAPRGHRALCVVPGEGKGYEGVPVLG